MDQSMLVQAEAERFAHLEWPFFDEPHRRLVRELARWAGSALGEWTHAPDADGVCRRLVREMGEAGWLSYAVPPPGASANGLDLRSICLLRETLADYGTWYLIALGVVAIIAMVKYPKGAWGTLAERFDIYLFPVQRRLEKH